MGVKGKVFLLLLGIMVLGLGLLFRGKKEPLSLLPKSDQIVKVNIEPLTVKEVHSGDGVMSLVMTRQKQVDGSSNYSFKVVLRGDKSERKILETSLTQGEEMEVPENTWSPDNKQVFLLEKGVGVTKYFVYKADGSKYKNGAEFLEVSELWEKNKNKYALVGITGWEGNDLLRVITQKENGEKGPSFWFVISSRSFIQLRTLP